jgi:hypothetical protein
MLAVIPWLQLLLLCLQSYRNVFDVVLYTVAVGVVSILDLMAGLQPLSCFLVSYLGNDFNCRAFMSYISCTCCCIA